MPSAETSIWLALKARVELMALSPAHPIAWPGEAFTPPTSGGLPGPYLVVTHMPNRGQRILIGGAGRERKQGILQIAVMSRLDQPLAVSIEHAGQVAAHFPADIWLHFGGVSVRITKRPDVMRGFRDDAAGRWMTPVSVSYECFA